ncbi:hypothetical protein EHQ58_10595 [Leptospira ognonensis]|uniref:Uncharacterized protein n=1 Tax=Leptospira ognonensis TaxID=2484945 RepID=A0A4V3JQY8_9LEPT|nr:hypothetical protein [Leptospira ognonensis]TGL57853.1 hypothetical protein EHQ58_10595 [Leptospira ognonensis]
MKYISQGIRLDLRFARFCTYRLLCAMRKTDSRQLIDSLYQKKVFTVPIISKFSFAIYANNTVLDFCICTSLMLEEEDIKAKLPDSKKLAILFWPERMRHGINSYLFDRF